MEELINELDIFVNEKAILSAQIKDIENKRNELAKERNTKKDQRYSTRRAINMIIKEEYDKSKISIPYNILEVRNGK